MSKLVHIITSLVLFQMVAGNVAPANEDNIIKEVVGHISTTLSTIHTKFLDLWGASDNNEFIDKVVVEGKAFGTKLGELANDLKEKAKSNTGDVNAATNEFIIKLQNAAEKLGENVGDGKYKEIFEKNIKAVVDETKTFASGTGELNDEVKNVIGKILESTRDTADKVSTIIVNEVKDN